MTDDCMGKPCEECSRDCPARGRVALLRMLMVGKTECISDLEGRMCATKKRATEMETILAALLDAAERQAAGFPVETERWFAVRDAARAVLPEKGVSHD